MILVRGMYKLQMHEFAQFPLLGCEILIMFEMLFIWTLWVFLLGLHENSKITSLSLDVTFDLGLQTFIGGQTFITN
jgi:hypothetical protein